MAKESGLGWTTLSIEESDGSTARDIKNDVTNFDMSVPRGVQDVTGLDKSGVERLLLLADFQATYNGIFNDAAALSHVVFSTIPSTSTVRAASHVISQKTLTVEVVLTDYILTRAASGEFTWSVPAMNADGAVPTWS